MTRNATEVIARKRDGETLSADEIADFISRFAGDEIPDYQMSALAMAIYLRGMQPDETAALTEAMLRSGTRLSWPTGNPVVDKHSTGGSGDTVSLILAPLLACCGLRVPMISGRGLGPTGGTLDKLESIPGFRTDLSVREIQEITERVGCVITGATANIAPADKKLYALRDVTATVASIPLITASIMSKKLAEGLNVLVLDVKHGSGAFMKSLDQARELARSLVETGRRMGVETTALISDMNQPLGRMVGNAIEVNTAVEVLKAERPGELNDLTFELGIELLVQSKLTNSRDEARATLRRHLQTGTAFAKFHQMVEAQGGDLDAARPVAPPHEILAERSGYVANINTETIGQTLIALGGGRAVASDSIDHSVGFEMLARLGEFVEAGKPLVRVFVRNDKFEAVRNAMGRAFTFAGTEPAKPPLSVERIS